MFVDKKLIDEEKYLQLGILLGKVTIIIVTSVVI